VSAVDRQYEDLLARIMREGTPKGDRTGTGTRSLFGAQLRYDLSKGFPLITTKRVHLKSVVGELLWFLSGSSNVSWLQDNGIRIWNEWADEDGELGPVYGVQWRSWNAGDGRHIDQISQVLETLKTNPDSRRMVVSAWNVGAPPPLERAGGVGWAPMAAMSARFWAAARAPICSALDQLVRKWWPCTNTSVDTQ